VPNCQGRQCHADLFRTLPLEGQLQHPLLPAQKSAVFFVVPVALFPQQFRALNPLIFCWCSILRDPHFFCFRRSHPRVPHQDPPGNLLDYVGIFSCLVCFFLFFFLLFGCFFFFFSCVFCVCWVFVFFLGWFGSEKMPSVRCWYLPVFNFAPWHDFPHLTIHRMLASGFRSSSPTCDAF